MLPGRNGIEVVRGLRAGGITTPVLMLTALTSEGDTVTGLDAGADDYLRKPFGLAELKARLRAIVRRERSEPALELVHGSLRLDLASRQATRNQRELQLTPRETAFLEYFLRNCRRTLSREMLSEALWSHDAELASNVIDVHIRRLRAKLHGPGESPVLHTVHGFGYHLKRAPMRLLSYRRPADARIRAGLRGRGRAARRYRVCDGLVRV